MSPTDAAPSCLPGRAGRKRAKLRLSGELLLGLLQMDGTRLYRVRGVPADAECVSMHYDFDSSTLVLLLESASFAEVRDGEPVPEVYPEVSESCAVKGGLVFHGWEWEGG